MASAALHYLASRQRYNFDEPDAKHTLYLGVYTLIYTMTGGGPNMDTMTLPLYMYRQAFVGYQLGYGTAISMILLVIGIVFSVLYTASVGIKCNKGVQR